VVNVPRFPRFVIEDWQHFGWGLSYLSPKLAQNLHPGGA
jgi:hypothetical protein